MIFLSHNYKDKALVEQFAVRLKEIFGQDHVFYDSWSIQPGDGIVDKMNAGLAACELFLFFVSKNSLQSNMVKLEWQNAVQKAATGKTKLVPVKLDDSFMPPILAQNLYIDLYGHGLEVALRQVVDVSQGRNTFSPGPQQFSNLRAYFYEEGHAAVVECHAEHYLEPISHFLFLVENKVGELNIEYKSGNMSSNGIHEGFPLPNGATTNAYFVGVERGTVPGFPFIVHITPAAGKAVRLAGVRHERKMNQWTPVPVTVGRRHA